MATIVAAAPISMDAFVEKQARADMLLNIVLAGVGNYWLTRDLPSVAATLPFGDSTPSLRGALIVIAVLMSLMLTLFVYAITVWQRKSGKIEPGLASDTRAGLAPFLLALKHLAMTLIPVVLIGMILQSTAPDLRFPPVVFTAMVTIIAALLAYFMSKSTTRATLRL